MSKQPADDGLIDVFRSEACGCPIPRRFGRDPDDLVPVHCFTPPTATLGVVSPGEDQSLELFAELLLLEDRYQSGVDGNHPISIGVLQWPGFVALEVDGLLLEIDILPPQATHL